MGKIMKIFCYCKLWYGVNVIGLPEILSLYAEIPRARTITQKSKFHN